MIHTLDSEIFVIILCEDKHKFKDNCGNLILLNSLIYFFTEITLTKIVLMIVVKNETRNLCFIYLLFLATFLARTLNISKNKTNYR